MFGFVYFKWFIRFIVRPSIRHTCASCRNGLKQVHHQMLLPHINQIYHVKVTLKFRCSHIYLERHKRWTGKKHPFCLYVAYTRYVALSSSYINFYFLSFLFMLFLWYFTARRYAYARSSLSPGICLSVRLSCSYVQTAENKVKHFSRPGSPIILVF